MPPLPRLCLAVLLGLTAALGQDSTPIDFEKARGILQRVNRGEPVSPEDRAYLERAKAARAAQNGQGRRDAPASEVRSSLGLIPLPELKSDYHGEDGGLYGAGRNDPPESLHQAAVAAAAKVTPLDADGKPSPQGKVVLLSVGMSNTTQEFSVFVNLAKADPKKNPAVVVVDGAQGGQSADRIASPDAPFWTNIDKRLADNGVNAKQVQSVWLKQAFPGPREKFPAEARKLEGYLQQDLAVIRARYPNLRLVFLSSRIYAGYATTGLNPEPHAYEGAFAVRWVIQSQLRDGGPPAGAPVLLWGPYLWADGEKGRASDVLVWKQADFGPDGTHPGENGRRKVAEQLQKFFHTSPYARGWYEAK